MARHYPVRFRTPAWAYHADTPDLPRSSRRPDRPDRTTGRTGSSPLRLGVTGHRVLDNEEALRHQVDAAMARALEARPGAGLVVVSSLAEGADRLVVHQGLRHRGAELHAVLPLPVDQYSEDFATAASRQEFDALLAAATSVEFAETAPTREEAYERAGYMMVARSDLVLAVWDGRPARGRGGTADIVDHARARGVPVVRIDGQIAHR